MHEGRKAVFVRIYSGALRRGDESTTRARDATRRWRGCSPCTPNRREQIERAGAGSIVVATGLKDAATGDTLSTPKAPIILERIDIYEPVISRAIEPKTRRARRSWISGWPSWPTRIRRSASTRTRRRARPSSAAWASCTSRSSSTGFEREYGVDANVGRPQVVYRETLAKPADGEARIERIVEDETLFGHARVHVAPRARAAGNELRMQLVKPAPKPGVKIIDTPQAILDAAMEGAREAMHSGPQGYPIEDIEVVITAIEYRPDASTPTGQKAAVGEALRHAWREAGTRLLEPIMKVEITCPEANVGDVLGDLNTRRGQIEDVGFRGQQRVIQAKVPLRRMFGYSTDLRSATQGRANYSMHFDSYDAWE